METAAFNSDTGIPCYPEKLEVWNPPVCIMKTGIHPKYDEVKVVCACGATFATRSTGGDKSGELHVEICSTCHPFFTGRQKLVDTEGRVDRFQRKMAKSKAIQDQRKANAKNN